MPLREYQCPDCHRQLVKICKAKYPEHIRCEGCGSQMEYKIGKPNYKLSFKAGYSESLGKSFNTEREYKNYLAEKDYGIL